MSVVIASNIASLQAQRQLGKVSAEVSTVFERLSSGQRINRAADDAAGLAVASGLEINRRVFAQGVRNYNDGISLLNVADGALEQLSSIVIRLKELAEQAANGTYGATQRRALDLEAQALSKEYTRIAKSSTFNGRGVFLSNFGDLRIQGSYGVNGGIQSSLGGAIGTGTIGSVVTTANGVASSNLASADLNGDGITDIVDAGTVGGNPVFVVSLGNGDGSFRAGVSYAMSAGSVGDMTLADLNNDGALDVITAGAAVNYRLGNGDGTFGALVSFSLPSAAEALSAGDLNLDGYSDIITMNSGGQSQVYLGSGSGTFSLAQTFSDSSSTAYESILADFNSDGILDYATGHEAGGDARLSVRLGTGSGTFGPSQTVESGNGGLTALAAGDINGDGLLDIIGTNYDGAVANVFIGRGNGSFTAGAIIDLDPAGSNAYAIDIADMNGDGNNDFVAKTDSTTAFFLGNGNGTFGAGTTFANTGTSTLFADVNTDGVLDIVSSGLVSYLSRATSGVSPLLEFELNNRANALQALTQFDQVLNRLSTQRGVIGAFQARIAVAETVLQATAENYTAASSRIRDADVAEETSKLVRVQILQQAASSVLAQANQQPAVALQLLR